MKLAILGVIVVTVGSARPADACSCGIGAPVVIPDGTSPVPTTVQFQLANPMIGSATITMTATTGGADVPLTTTAHDSGWISVAPTAPLTANAAYTLHVHQVVGGDTDVAVTVSGAAVDPLPYAGIDSLVLETEPVATTNGSGQMCGGCVALDANGNVSRVKFGRADPSGRFSVLEVLDATGANVVAVYPLGLPYAHDAIVGVDQCGQEAPALVAGAMQCARVVAYDATGTRDGEATHLCATVNACAAYDLCAPNDACASATGGGDGDAPGSPSNAGCCSTGGAPNVMALALVALVSTFAGRRSRSRRA